MDNEQQAWLTAKVSLNGEYTFISGHGIFSHCDNTILKIVSLEKLIRFTLLCVCHVCGVCVLCVYVCVYVCMYVCMRVCVCVCMHVCIAHISYAFDLNNTTRTTIRYQANNMYITVHNNYEWWAEAQDSCKSFHSSCSNAQHGWK